MMKADFSDIVMMNSLVFKMDRNGQKAVASLFGLPLHNREPKSKRTAALMSL